MVLGEVSATWRHGPALLSRGSAGQLSEMPPGSEGSGFLMSSKPGPSWTVAPSVGHRPMSASTQKLTLHAQLEQTRQSQGSPLNGTFPAQVHAGCGVPRTLQTPE